MQLEQPRRALVVVAQVDAQRRTARATASRETEPARRSPAARRPWSRRTRRRSPDCVVRPSTGSPSRQSAMVKQKWGCPANSCPCRRSGRRPKPTPRWRRLRGRSPRRGRVIGILRPQQVEHRRLDREVGLGHEVPAALRRVSWRSAARAAGKAVHHDAATPRRRRRGRHLRRCGRRRNAGDPSRGATCARARSCP